MRLAILIDFYDPELGYRENLLDFRIDYLEKIVADFQRGDLGTQ